MDGVIPAAPAPPPGVRGGTGDAAGCCFPPPFLFPCIFPATLVAQDGRRGPPGSIYSTCWVLLYSQLTPAKLPSRIHCKADGNLLSPRACRRRGGGRGGCRGGGRGGQRREPACCWLISAVEVQMEQAPAPVCLSWRLNLESPRTPSPCREERGGGRGGRGAEPRGRAHLVNPLEAAWKPGLRGKMRVERGRVGMCGSSE